VAEAAAFVDASPLIGLARVGGLGWLPRLYGRVVITRAVRDEVLRGQDLPGERAIRDALRDKQIELSRRTLTEPAFPELDDGEASILRAALDHGESALVVVDDLMARTVAAQRGILFTGTAGVIIEARRARLIRSVRPVFARLAQTDFRLSPKVVEEILARLGER
jgi:predicted nucleic acid-binding protein